MWKCLFLWIWLCLPSFGQGLLMLAGGGAEGDQGDQNAWSYELYGRLVENGDIDGDGVVRVAILASDIPNRPSDANWLPDYFVWLGTTRGIAVDAVNVEVATRSDANNATVVGGVANADVVFIKGGDQGVYYDAWNQTLLESHIRTVASAGGALGGTSAGAMSMAEYSFSGGADLISADVLADAHTIYLDDAGSPATSGIHTDFFGFLPNAVIDTHYTQRGRLGRLVGILAKSIDDSGNDSILGLGIEMKTGVVIQGSLAEVIGVGSVSFLQRTAESEVLRDPGKPLWFSHARLDRLTAGWQFDLSTSSPRVSVAPTGTVTVSVNLSGLANQGGLTIDGGLESDKEKFAHTGDYYPADDQRRAGINMPYVRDAVGFTDAGNSNNRMDKHETLFHLLYDRPGDLGVLAFANGQLERTSSIPDQLTFAGTGAILIDVSSVTHKGLSPYESNWAVAGGALRAVSLVNARLHVLGDSESRAKAFDTVTRQLVFWDGGTGPGGDPSDPVNEQEPNDDLNTAEDYRNASYPVTINGTITSLVDQDHFEIELTENETVNITLAVPGGGDYDLYLLDRRGRTELRSINDGLGLDEFISFTHTNRRTGTYFILVESYTGSSTTENYTLSIEQ